MWTFALITLTLILFLMPLLPSLGEWIAARDAEPLQVVQEYDGDVRHFAQSFRQYLRSRLEIPLLADINEPPFQGVLTDGTSYLIAGKESVFSPSAAERHASAVRRMVLSRGALDLPSHFLFEQEVFTRGDLRTGEETYLRAALSEGNITLGPRSQILRWTHAQGDFSVGEGSLLFGRASAEGTMRLGEHCQFERLHAPQLVFGNLEDITPPYVPAETLPLFELEDKVLDHSANRWLVRGDVEIPAHHRFVGNLVVRGKVFIGKGAVIQGSVKSHGDLVLENHVLIQGSLVSAEFLSIGQGSMVKGPVIAERGILLYDSVIIGTPEIPTTVTAPELLISPGVVIHGTAHAVTHGMVKKLEEAA